MVDNILAKQYNAASLLRYAMPTIAGMILMSAYTIIDGIFVAQLVGEDALAAINIVYPAICVVLAATLMLATGSNAIIGKYMGEGKYEEARSYFSFIYIVGTVLGMIATLVSFLFPEKIVDLLGAEGRLVPYAEEYLLAFMAFAAPMFLQTFAQLFFVVAGKPMLGFTVCLMGGIANIVFDYILISEKFFDLGIVGAGIATGIGMLVPGLFGTIYFWVKKNGTLYFGKPKFCIKLLGQASYNGMSEMVTQISTAISTFLFNIILFKIAGEAGVAAISVILYLQMFQMAAYIGFALGVSPIISYKYGAQSIEDLKHIVKLSLRYMLFFSAIVISISVGFAEQLVNIFISQDSSTFNMTKEGLIIFSVGYLFMGVNVFVSAMFTAFSNGKISAIVSLSRTLVILLACLAILPTIFGIYGVWVAVPIAELLSLGVSYFCFRRYKKVYHYA